MNDHHHGHDHDRGARAMLRYLRYLPEMWRSSINDAVVAMVDPQPGERVVDLGAGLGAGVTVAAKRGASVVAVEPTPYMRHALSLRRLAQRGRTHIDVVDGAAERIPVDDASVDAVWAVNTMHHWTDPERGAREIARVLRPGGRIVLVDEDFTDPTHPDHERFGSEHGPEHHGFTMVEADRMGALLRDAGIDDVTATNRSIDGRPAIAVTFGV